jgi:PilZ domain
MPDDRITNAKDLLKQVSDFGERMKERRRYERKKLLWAATVEVRGQRFEGMIVDLSAGGARIKFDAAVAAGDELTLVLKQLDELGAKVVWQREGEAGLQFLLAPEEVAARIQQKLPTEAIAAEARNAPAPAEPAPAAAAPRPASAAPRRRATLMAAAILAGLGGLIGGSVVVAHSFPAKAPAVLALNGGASGQHSCGNLLDKVGGATNQVDFSLNVASAVQAKCLDIHHLGPSSSDRNEGMVSVTKVPLH